MTDKPSKSLNKSLNKPGDKTHYGILPSLLGFQVRRAQFAMFQHFQKYIEMTDITPSQTGVLVLVGENPGISQVALAKAIGIERASLGEVIGRFEKQGWITRKEAPWDKRSLAVYLTEAGEKLVKELLPAIQAHEELLSNNFTTEERETLIHLLRRLADNFD
ncbi:MAG: MarR family transcriptional regulator [Gammaproteobacteria bacterium]|nr:MarR family transcriptional regulator [Gammaproteobacteria bacterium]